MFHTVRMSPGSFNIRSMPNSPQEGGLSSNGMSQSHVNLLCSVPRAFVVAEHTDMLGDT